jgi:hypothetical protein
MRGKQMILRVAGPSPGPAACSDSQAKPEPEQNNRPWYFVKTGSLEYLQRAHLRKTDRKR